MSDAIVLGIYIYGVIAVFLALVVAMEGDRATWSLGMAAIWPLIPVYGLAAVVITALAVIWDQIEAFRRNKKGK